jgi:hypothetical protein
MDGVSYMTVNYRHDLYKTTNHKDLPSQTDRRKPDGVAIDLRYQGWVGRRR